MHTFPAALLLAAFFGSAVAAQDPAPTPAVPATPIGAPVAGQKPAKQDEKPVYDEKADAKQDVAAAVARAKKDNKRVLIQWGANWCGWCKWLAGTMKSNAEVHRKLMYEYEVVHVDVGRFDKHLDLAKELGAEFKAIPYLTLLDADGKALVQQNTEPFEAKIDGKNGHDPKKLLEFLAAHEAKPLDAKAVLNAGMVQAAKENKRVFLHFGAPWCGYCHRLEDWMAKPEIAAVLTKDFVDVKIDNDRMVGGKDIFKAQLAAAEQQEGGIPWFVFLDHDGKLLAHSNGPKGNVGFPVQPHELEHFATMLNAVKVHITEAEVEMLRVSLLPPKKVAPATPAPGTERGTGQ